MWWSTTGITSADHELAFLQLDAREILGLAGTVQLDEQLVAHGEQARVGIDRDADAVDGTAATAP